MASGFGAKGSEGRCYPLWQGFSKVFIRDDVTRVSFFLCFFLSFCFVVVVVNGERERSHFSFRRRSSKSFVRGERKPIRV